MRVAIVLAALALFGLAVDSMMVIWMRPEPVTLPYVVRIVVYVISDLFMICWARDSYRNYYEELDAQSSTS